MSKWTWIILIITVAIVIMAVLVIYWTMIRTNIPSNTSVTKTTSPRATASSKANTTKNQTSSNNLNLPEESVEGKDISNIPPYPGSIRSFYQETDPNNISAEYYAQGKSQEVLDYFKTKLVEKGWVLRAQDPNLLSFTLDNANATIEIGEVDSNANIIVYRINYIVEATLSEEQSPTPETT